MRAPSLLPALSCLSHTSGQPRQATLQRCILPGSWKSAPRCHILLRNQQEKAPEHPTAAGGMNSPWLHLSATQANKAFCTNRYHSHGNCTLTRVWSSFPSLPAQGMHPTQLWNTPNSTDMRLKNSHCVLGIYGWGAFISFQICLFGHVVQPVYHLQY